MQYNMLNLMVAKEMAINIREITPQDRETVEDILTRFWGGETIVVHGEQFALVTLPGLKAILADEIAGLLHYQIVGEVCEILSLVSLRANQGIGSALLLALEDTARAQGCNKLSLVTTNDNLHALGFYQRRGFHLAALFPGQVAHSRAIKPSIPSIGEDNIPIRDELQLEKLL